MAIAINCRCGYNISAPERLAGRTLRCPKCLGEFTVPQAAAAPPPAPMPAAVPLPATVPFAPAPEPFGAATEPFVSAPDPFATGDPFAAEPLAAVASHGLEPAAPEVSPPHEPDLALEQAFELAPDAAAVAPEEHAPDLNFGTLEPGQADASAEEGLVLDEANLAPAQDGDFAMNEDEMGLLLMEDEPKKKK